MEVLVSGVWKPLLDITSSHVVVPEGGMRVSRPMVNGCKLRFKNRDGEWVYLKLEKGAVLI